MRVMQVAVDEVVGMVAVRDRRMAARRSVHVRGLVTRARVLRGAGVGVGRGHRDNVLVDVVPVRVVQMPVVNIVHMAVVTDRDVSAIRAVDVLMVRVRRAAHPSLPRVTCA
jgi:hypothetical protein